MGKVIGTARVVDLSYAGVSLDCAGNGMEEPLRKGAYCEIIWTNRSCPYPGFLSMVNRTGTARDCSFTNRSNS
jgi:hypothetical protein